MTRIKIWQEGERLHYRAYGHAEGSVKVCAGVSALTYALLGMCRNAPGAEMKAKSNEKQGMMEISANRSQWTEMAFLMAAIGVVQLEVEYEDFVSVEIDRELEAGGRNELYA